MAGEVWPVRRIWVGIAVLGLGFGLLAPVPARAEDPAMLAFSLAWFDANQRDDQAAEARIEYRAARRYWLFKPFGGIMATSDGAAHAFAGVLIDLYFGHHLVVTPSFAPGVFTDGDGKDLGSVIEFRSQIEIAWRFDNRSRIGLSLNHISNASIANRNPGVESLALTYVIPFATLF